MTVSRLDPRLRAAAIAYHDRFTCLRRESTEACGIPTQADIASAECVIDAIREFDYESLRKIRAGEEQ